MRQGPNWQGGPGRRLPVRFADALEMKESRVGQRRAVGAAWRRLPADTLAGPGRVGPRLFGLPEGLTGLRSVDQKNTSRA